MRILESKIVTYPVFLKCSEVVTDEFWKKLFIDLSDGKCPKCIFISNGIIYSANKKTPFSFLIPKTVDRDITEIATEFHSLLTLNTTLCSSFDNEQKRSEMLLKKKTAHTLTTSNINWSSIRKKHEREMHIVNYVINMKEFYKMDWNRTKELFSLILVGMMMKSQTSKDVVFDSGEITSINGIEYDESNGRFTNIFFNNDTKEKEMPNSVDSKISDHWKKYLLTTSTVL